MRLVLLSLLFASPAIAAEQFDLVCTGTHKPFSGPDEPFREEFRVDLRRMLYCSGECRGPDRIVRANAQSIYFFESDDPVLGKGATYVDRETGQYTEYLSALGHLSQTKADCVPAGFKGFPTAAAVKRRF